MAGRSALALAAVSGTSALSFYAYARLRKAITGVEELVLLEHVWVALLVSAATLWALHVSRIVAHLDVVALGLAFFLACGR